MWWSVYHLKAEVLPIAVRHRQDPDCAPVGARGCVGYVFGGGTFREKFLPQAPSSKTFIHFFLCHGVSIVSRQRYCRLQSTATERCDDTKDPDCTPVGGREGARTRRMRFSGEELFEKSSSPMPPLQKLSYIFPCVVECPPSQKGMGKASWKKLSPRKKFKKFKFRRHRFCELPRSLPRQQHEPRAYRARER